jgi:hypothetical protein
VSYFPYTLRERERERERIVTTDFKTVMNENFPFTVDCICFSGYILDANNYKGKCQLFMIQNNSCGHCFNTATLTINIDVYVQQK